MKNLALSYFNQTDLIVYGLVLFLIVFLMQLISLFLRDQDETIKRLAQLPLEENPHE